MSNSYHGHLDTGHVSQRSRDPGTCLMSQSMISADLTTDNRQSIEHSLALIRHHVKVITCHKQRKIFSKQKIFILITVTRKYLTCPQQKYFSSSNTISGPQWCTNIWWSASSSSLWHWQHMSTSCVSSTSWILRLWFNVWGQWQSHLRSRIFQ